MPDHSGRLASGDTRPACATCANFFVPAGRPPELGVSYALHATLYRCAACGTYWEEHERYACAVTPEQARADFPHLFP